MKIIHSLRLLNGRPISDVFLNMMELSAILAKKHYNNITLYTTEDVAEAVRHRKIPYNHIDTKILSDVPNKSYVVPKIKVYSIQTEPFIHIDYDAFLFNKVEFTNTDKLYATHPEGLSVVSKIPPPIFFNALDGFYTTYVREARPLIDSLPKKFIDNILWDVIPNFSVFGGYDYKLISEASQYCLNIYNNNRNLIDNYWWNSVVLEQLFIPSAIRMIRNRNDNFTYLFENLPNSFTLKNKTDFPISIFSQGEIITFNSESDLYDKIGYDFKGFLHLHGEKEFPIIQKILTAKIQKERELI